MGPDKNTLDAPANWRLGDQLTRSLIAKATVLAIASLFACWFGTRAVVDGIVNYEGRETSRQWAVAFAHVLSQSEDDKSNDLMQPYKAGSNPERFKALDDARNGRIRCLPRDPRR